MNRIQIILSDETKVKIKKMAKINKRTIGKEIEFILERVKLNDSKEYEI